MRAPVIQTPFLAQEGEGAKFWLDRSPGDPDLRAPQPLSTPLDPPSLPHDALWLVSPCPAPPGRESWSKARRQVPALDTSGSPGRGQAPSFWSSSQLPPCSFHQALWSEQLAASMRFPIDRSCTEKGGGLRGQVVLHWGILSLWSLLAFVTSSPSQLRP